MTHYTDHTRTELAQRCPRKRYLEFEYPGSKPGQRGFRRKGQKIELLTGGQVHLGIAIMLRGVMAGQKDSRELVGNAVDAAINSVNKLENKLEEGFWSLVAEKGLDLEAQEDQAYVAREQAALIEALIRGWASVRLPGILREFEVVEVETEHTVKLWEREGSPLRGEGRVPIIRADPDGTQTITGYRYENESLEWQSRPDAVLRHRGTGDLHILSAKTVNEWKPWKDWSYQIAMQGVSEIPGVEQDLGERISMVEMEYLLKGQRKKEKDSGIYITWSPLIRGWVQRGITPDQDRYAWRYKWKDPETGKQRQLIKGGGEGWTRYEPFAEDGMGIEKWLELLASGTMEPQTGENPLELQFLCRPISRKGEQIEEWKISTVGQERDIALAPKEPVMENLARNFPRYRHACTDFMRKCWAYKICWESGGIESGNPVDGEEFVWREAHHSPEREQMLVQIGEKL